MATRDYTLGKGKITFIKDDTASIAVLNAGGFRDFGNAPAMAVSLATEKLEHQSSRDGIGLVDMSVVTKTSATGSFTLDEPNADNLAMFFMDPAAAAGTPATVTTQAVYKDIFTATNVWYPVTLVGGGVLAATDVVKATNNQGTGATTITMSGSQTSPDATSGHTYTVRVKGEGASGAATVICRMDNGAWCDPITITDATPFAVKYGSGAGTSSGISLAFGTISATTMQEGDEFTFATTYTVNTGARVTDITAFACNNGSLLVEGTDYTLDAAAGLVMFLTAPGVIATCTVSGKTGNSSAIEGFSTSQMKGWLYYVANPAAGIPVDVVGYCRVSPTGDLALIGTDWTQMQFTVDFLKVDGFPIVKITTREKV